MDYGGGDNDCSFADPLRPQSMLVLTPRRDTDGNSVEAAKGNTVTVYESNPGELPDVRIGHEHSARRAGSLAEAEVHALEREQRLRLARLPSDRPQRARRRRRGTGRLHLHSLLRQLHGRRPGHSQPPRCPAAHPTNQGHRPAHRLGHAGRVARGEAPASARRPHRQRSCRHRRLRRRRRVDGAEQRRRHLRRPAVRARRFRVRGWRLARRQAIRASSPT